MGKIKDKKNSIEKFMSGESGQRFFNIAYSVGAAIVILGALFKILHITGGDTLLAVGMGTEVLMFILTAFERPYSERPQSSGGVVTVNGDIAPSRTDTEGSQVGFSGSLVVNAGGTAPYPSEISQPAEIATAGAPSILSGSMTSGIEENIKQIDDSLKGYVDLMTELNRNVAGLNTIYELQLKSASSQLNSLDYAGKNISEMHRMYEGTAEKSKVFQEEADRLTENMKRLNEVYENMLRAMNAQIKG